MPNREAIYFLAPVGNPPEGPIRLGNIISAPAFADDPINERCIAPGEAAIEVIELKQENFRFDMNVKNERIVGIWTSFLQTLGIGGDATVDWSKEHSEQWAFKNLKTVSFSPTIAYVSQCLKDKGVEDLTLRPQIGVSNTISTKQSQSDGEPFVFAFRLRRVKISRKGKVNHESYTKGTVLGIKEDGNDQDVEIVVEGVENFDAGGEEFQLNSKDAFDEGSLSDGLCKAVIVEED
ncbi:Uncharacterized protein HZ326_26707 [Fusarium oxysporum f. sp. albedinis]|nr:Uncharacterized protein HZ326_26707 [Fusarium oxysporum f. sp. albedinis]